MSKRTMRKSLLLSAVVFMAILALAPLTQAAVYEGYARKKEQFLWWTIKWEVWIKIDTSADTFYVRWKGPSSYKGSYFNGMLAYIKMWDDKGFEWHYGPRYIPSIGPKGEVTKPYTHTNTWAHAEVRWSYWYDPLWWELKTVHVAVWVGG